MFLQWDLNNKELHKEYVELCELEFETYFNGVVDNIVSYHNLQDLKVLTIAGPTSSGKTTIALKLIGELAKKGIMAKIISMDDFYRRTVDMPVKADGKPNFETIKAIDVDMLIKCIDEAVKYGETKLPEFNFVKGARESEMHNFSLKEDEIVIIEGIHGLNPEIINNIATKKRKSIYITVGEKIFLPGNTIFSKRDIRLLRRLVRDYKFRGATPELTFFLWETVRESESIYIFPYEPNADIKINSLYKYELSVIKDQAEELLKKIPEESKYYGRAAELMRKLSFVPCIDESLVPESSLVREFIGNSIYYKK